MTWQKTAEDRKRDAQVYGPEYRRYRKVALRRAGGACEKCGRRNRRLQVDHVIPVSQGGGHELANLQVLCSGPGSCHAAKTATEGGGYRARRGTGSPSPRAPRTRWDADPQPRPGTRW